MDEKKEATAQNSTEKEYAKYHKHDCCDYKDCYRYNVENTQEGVIRDDSTRTQALDKIKNFIKQK